MRLTAIIIFLAIVQVSASSFGQKVTYLKKDVTLVKLFKEIKKQTGFNVVWYEETLDATKIVGARFKDASVEEVMSKALNGMQLTYTISKNSVVIKEKERSFLEKISEAIHSFVKDIHVRGKITDEYNKPLKGATVKIKGTNKSVITDEDGNFYFENVKEKSVLVISFLGFKTIEKDASENLGGIQLEEGFSELAEVQINAGYYTVNDRERTGNISRITSETIDKQPVNNPLLALQNRVPGVEITQQSGVPGGGVKVQIRGQNSISMGNDPLYIVDEVQYPSVRLNTSNSFVITQDGSPLSLINPGDIESIEVLKDADATAIYGSRGANGVILITTKKGSVGEVKINANISKGFSEVGHHLNLMNTEQYLSMRMEAFKNDNLTPISTDYDVNGTWDKKRYTDWQKELIGGTANIINSTLSVSGGNKGSNYLMSGNYYKEGTVFPGDFGYKRGGVHASLNLGSLEKKLNINFIATYNHIESNLPSTDLTSYITLAPNAPDPYDQYGKLNWSYNNTPIVFNPMSFLLYTIDATTDNLIGNVNLNYRILKNLVFKTSLGYTTIKRTELAKSPLEAQPPAYDPTSLDRSSQFGNTYNNSWIAEPQLVYDVKIGKGKLNALVGMSFQQNTTEIRNIKASNFSSDELLDNISSGSIFNITESSFSKYKYAALFTRFNYNLSDKYFINLTGRRDGSSRFGPGNQFANFGAIGASWIFSEENLIKNNFTFLTFGKLRASYGVTGNDQILDYQYLQLYSSSFPYQNTPTLITSRIGNPGYGWETNYKAEAALQLGFLNDRINVQIAYFRNKSTNQLVSTPLPPSVGFNLVQANLPADVQNTGWEFDTNFKIINKQFWKWSAGFNLTIPKNKLIAYPGLSTSNLASTYIIGQPLNIRRYLNTSVDKQTGLYVFEDKNGNGLQDDKDRYLNKFLGQIFYGGLQNSISYKQFNLSFLISFTKQNGNSYLSALSFSPGFFFPSSPLSNQPTAVMSRWQKSNDQSEIPKYSTTVDNYFNLLLGTSTGSQSISDDSFIRLKNISFSYSIPKYLISKFKLNGLEFNLQAQNLFTITKYIGLDPEGNQLANRLPSLRTISIGLKLTL